MSEYTTRVLIEAANEIVWLKQEISKRDAELNDLTEKLDWLLTSTEEGSLPFWQHKATEALTEACKYGNEWRKANELLDEMSNVLGRAMAYIRCDECPPGGECESCEKMTKRCNEVLGKCKLGVTGVKEDE